MNPFEEQIPTLTEALTRAAQTPAGVRFCARDGTLERHTFDELLRDATRFAQTLRSRGLAPGDCVAIVLSTSYDMVVAIFGTLLARAVPTCLATPRLGRMADYSGATATMLDAAHARLVLTDASTAKNMTAVIERSACAPDLALVEELRAAPVAAAEIEAARAEDLALIQFSSGTTVDPKPVALTHANLMANTNAILRTLPGRVADHSGCSWLPLHHDMGLIGGLFTAVHGRGDMTLVRPEDFVGRPLLWLKAMADSRATISPAPNFALQMCVDRVRDEDLANLDLSHWRLALIGAETVREHTLRRFSERFAVTGFRHESFTPVYGLAEATLAVTFSEPERAPLSLRVLRTALAQGRVELSAAPVGGATEPDPETIVLMSVGRPLFGFGLELRDAGGTACGPDRVGRIFVRGPSVMREYLGRADATAAAVRDGWLDTGDLGFLHAGELFIYGRERDILILNGRNHDPHSVEFALDVVPGLDHDRAAAVPLEVEARGTEGFAVLVEKERGKLDDAPALAQRAREAVIAATGLVPERVLIVETGRLPRTTSGKIKRGAARRMLVAGEFEAIATSER